MACKFVGGYAYALWLVNCNHCTDAEHLLNKIFRDETLDCASEVPFILIRACLIVSRTE